MIFIYRYFSGFIKVRFFGTFPERVLNMCAGSGIALWGTKSSKDGFTAFLTVKDFRFLPFIVKSTGIRVHIEEKRGFPFIINRYKNRWGIFIGLVAFILFLEFMSGFVWIIEINGNKNVSEDIILDSLKEIGIYEGIKTDKVSAKNDSQRLLLELDSLAWASLNIEGSRLTVNVTETEKKEKKDNRPCNLKAEFDGVITKIDLNSGNSVVKVGDTVKKGDVLVSGIIENAGGTRFVNSEGTVTAEVTRKFSLNLKFETKKVMETGKKSNKSVIEVFGIKIPLYLGGETRNYNTTLGTKQLKIFGVKLPFRVYTREFRYTEIMKISKTADELKKELIKGREKLIKQEKITDYTVKSEEFKEIDDGITLEFTVVSEQNIAYKDFLLISTGNQGDSVVK